MDEAIKIPIVIEGDKAFLYLSDFEKAAKKTSVAVKGMADPLRSTANAGFAFNQILREAPSFAYSFQTGILGISNNLPIFTDALKKASEAGASKTKIIKDLAANLVSLPALLSIGSLLLIQFGDSLFGAGQKAETSKKALDELNETLASGRTRIAAFADEIDQLNALSKLNIEVSFNKGGTLLGLQGELVSKSEELFRLRSVEEKKLKDLSDKIYNDYQNNIINEKEYNQQLDNIGKDRSALWTKELGMDYEVRGLRLKVAAQRKRDREEEISDAKSANDKAAADYEKYVSKIIAEAKKFNSVFKDGIDLQLKFSVFDSVKDEFTKSIEYLNKFKGGQFNYKFSNPISIDNIEFPPEEVKAQATEFGVMFQKELNDYFNQPGEKIDFSLVNINEDQIKKLNELKNKLAEFRPLAENIGNAFATAFDDIASGGNALKAVGEAAKQLVIDLIKTAIQAFIVRQLLGAFVPGSGALTIGKGIGSLIGGIPRFAAGGVVSGPTLGLIGEGISTSRMNPEVIAPLDQLQSFFGSMLHDVLSGSSGGGAIQQIGSNISIPDTVALRFDGNDLVGTMTLVKQRQLRAG